MIKPGDILYCVKDLDKTEVNNMEGIQVKFLSFRLFDERKVTTEIVTSGYLNGNTMRFKPEELSLKFKGDSLDDNDFDQPF